MNKFIFRKKVLSALLVGSISATLTVSAAANTIKGTLKVEPIMDNRKIKTEDVSCKHQKLFDKVLNELVEDGKMSEGKADSIKQYIDKKTEENSNNSKGTFKKHDLLDELKEQNLITSDEEKLIKKEIQEQLDERLEEKLEGLRKNGVLTEKNVKGIVKYFREHREMKKAEFEKMKKMDGEQKKAYIQKMKQEMKNPYEEMVEKKIITKEQAEQVKKALQKKPGNGKQDNSNMQPKQIEENKNNINELPKQIEENKNNINEQPKQIEENKNNINEQPKKIEENKNNIPEQPKPIQENKNNINNQQKPVEENKSNQ